MATVEMGRLIKDLREKTGAGITDCKKALEESDGRLEEALTALRKKGLADAAKRLARATKEGAVAFAVAGKAGAIIELNCETDFVARTDEFKALAQILASKAAAGELRSLDEAAARVQPVQTRLGENMGLRRFERFVFPGEGLIAGYIHLGAKKGALIELSAPSAAVAGSPAAMELAKELLLQIVGHQRLDHRINGSLHEERQAVQRQADAMIGEPVLREIIRTDALVAFARADLLLPLVGVFLVLLLYLALEQS